MRNSWRCTLFDLICLNRKKYNRYYIECKRKVEREKERIKDIIKDRENCLYPLNVF